METETPLPAVEADAASLNYVGQWRGLVSTTNWEKGRIINEWRQAMRAGGAEPPQWSDDAWSRRVGQVTGQHVGRLRRVYERFGAVRGDYPGLYWSHFQAALDWADAEMWLEGAVQNDWSISEMRARRWETSGAAERPRDDDVVDSELDEDVDPAIDGRLSQVRDPSQEVAPAAAAADLASKEQGPKGEAQKGEAQKGEAQKGEAQKGEGSAAASSNVQSGVAFDADAHDDPIDAANEGVRPFANLAELPHDLADAFEAFKLAILRHKLARWQEISRDDLLGILDALKQLALAPAAG